MIRPFSCSPLRCRGGTLHSAAMAHAKVSGRRRKVRVGGPNHGVKPTRRKKQSLRATRVRMRQGLEKP